LSCRRRTESPDRWASAPAAETASGLLRKTPGHSASVVFYGGPPPEEEMARIIAPVLGFYGENDARVTATVEPTQRAMTRLGKQYEAVVYPKATHSFVVFQDIGQNNRAVADAWPRTIQFFRRHLN